MRPDKYTYQIKVCRTAPDNAAQCQFATAVMKKGTIRTKIYKMLHKHILSFTSYSTDQFLKPLIRIIHFLFPSQYHNYLIF